MEFTMPQEEGNRIGGQDMPAMWFLNANIPRTVQVCSDLSPECFGMPQASLRASDVTKPHLC